VLLVFTSLVAKYSFFSLPPPPFPFPNVCTERMDHSVHSSHTAFSAGNSSYVNVSCVFYKLLILLVRPLHLEAVDVDT
jgi:hypothetical protein